MKAGTDLTIRPARPDDALVAAELLYQTMLWEGDTMFGCDPRHTVLETLAGLFLFSDGRLSRRHAFIAEMEGQIAGLLMAYPGKAIPRLDISTGCYLFGYFSLAALVRVAWRSLAIAGPEAKRGEYYISNVAVRPRFQGHGIGSRLLAFAEHLARSAGLSRVSLCVDMHNDGAFRLYQRTGYRVVLTRFYKPRAIPPVSKGYWRMVKTLSPVSA
jgi:ribosomal protein S18 acetylase RimI-like enzyme